MLRKHASVPPHLRWLGVFSSSLLFLVIWTQVLNGWNIVPAVHAAPQGNPNPKLSAPAWLQTSHPVKPADLGIYVTSKPDPTVVPIHHPSNVSMPPLTLTLSPAAQHVVSKDGTFDLTIAAATVSQAQIQAAGGAISINVVQLDAGSGGSQSGHIFLGTYQILLLNAKGDPLTDLVLAHPLKIGYHLLPRKAGLIVKGQTVYTLWNGNTSGSTTSNQTGSTTTKSTSTSGQVGKPTFVRALAEPTQPTLWSVESDLSGAATSTATTTSTPIPHTALSGSTVTFGTQAPQASWGTPQDSQVGLNAGGLGYNYPLVFPSGPGGLISPSTLVYSSGSVNESHNVQAAATWLGEGWNFSVGSISTSTRNVTPGGTNHIENVWNINDPSGISGQLIPPDLNAATSAPANPSMATLPAQYIWHTAPESHAKVQEVNFNGIPCWHVWLPNGIMEEFGCTDASRQAVRDANGNWNPYRWNLNLMVDRFGNQVRINYQQNFPTGVVRDAVISSIEYDDPTCHQTTFTGATAGCNTWNPKIRIIFDASTQVSRLANTTGGCQSWSSTTWRCDDPVDLSGSGGLPIAKVINTYVLNDIQVQVQGNVLHKYLFSYEQIPPHTITDPATGQSESVAGYLDLTQIQEQGTNGTTLNAPVVNLSYQTNTQHYLDTLLHANPSTNCGPSWTPGDASGCFLWSESYNARYLQVIDNGRGWHETITWAEARSNVHGVDSGAVNNVFTCDGHESSTNLCGQADDEAWSRVVVSQRVAVSNGVTSTWGYQYFLRANWPAPPCSNCHQGDTWSNQNDNDYADYYNEIFTSFASAQVTLPDNSSQTHFFASSDGWGIALSTITCFISSCNVAPYWNPNPGMAGHETQEQDFSATGQLLAVHSWTLAMNCPPPGVPHSNNASGPPNDPGTTELISELDTNNPVVVCDPRVTQEDSYQVEGVTDINNYLSDARVLHLQTNYTYDGDNQGPNRVTGYDYGNVSKVDETGNDIGGAHVVSATTFYPNDNLAGGVYLTNLAAITQTEDGTGASLTCSQVTYGANSSVTTPPILPSVTQSQDFVNSGGCNNGRNVLVKTTYDTSGTPLGVLDAVGHTSCTIGSSSYTTCAAYDTFGTHVSSVTDARSNTTTATYNATTAAGGYGQWLLSTTDVNGQTTSYQYDVLGRLTAVVRPLDSSGSPSATSTYTSTCTNGGTTPCLEIDTATRTTVGGPTTTMQQWYDGWGHLIETQVSGPSSGTNLLTYSVYDALGRETSRSLPYSVTSGLGYLTPDQTKPRTVTNYDALGRSLGNVTYSDATTIVLSTTLEYSVAQGVSFSH